MHEIVTLVMAGVYKTTARTTRYTSGLISSYCCISQRELMLGFGGGVKMTNRAGYDKWQRPLTEGGPKHSRMKYMIVNSCL